MREADPEIVALARRMHDAYCGAGTDISDPLADDEWSENRARWIAAAAELEAENAKQRERIAMLEAKVNRIAPERDLARAEVERLKATLALPMVVWALEQRSVGVDVEAEDGSLRYRVATLIRKIDDLEGAGANATGEISKTFDSIAFAAPELWHVHMERARRALHEWKRALGDAVDEQDEDGRAEVEKLRAEVKAYKFAHGAAEDHLALVIAERDALKAKIGGYLKTTEAEWHLEPDEMKP